MVLAGRFGVRRTARMQLLKGLDVTLTTSTADDRRTPVPCVHAAATTPVQRLGVVFARVTQPCQPSPVPRPDRHRSKLASWAKRGLTSASPALTSSNSASYSPRPLRQGAAQPEEPPSAIVRRHCLSVP